jgi:hypothetical protein
MKTHVCANMKDIAKVVGEIFAAGPDKVATIRIYFKSEDGEDYTTYYIVRTTSGDGIVAVNVDRQPVAIAPVNAPIAIIRKIFKQIKEKPEKIEVVEETISDIYPTEFF